MTDISILAIDLAKHSFQVCATTAEGVVIYNRKYSRGKLEQLLTEHPTCLVAMEACRYGGLRDQPPFGAVCDQVGS